jgi:hypothetical protein
MGELKAGERLHVSGGAAEAVVTALRVEEAPEGATFTTFNFGVAGWHTYFVAPKASPPGSPTIWVHNMCDTRVQELLAKIEKAAPHHGERILAVLRGKPADAVSAQQLKMLEDAVHQRKAVLAPENAVKVGTQNAETAWATKTGRAYDRRVRKFWREYEGQTIGDWEVAKVNRRLEKGVQPDLVFVNHKTKAVSVHDVTSSPDPRHLAKGRRYVEVLKKNYPGYSVEYTEGYWRGMENTVEALSSSGTMYFPGTTRP